MNQSIHTNKYQSLPGVEPRVEEGPPINLGPRKNAVMKKQRATKSNSEQSVPQQIPFDCLQWQLTRHTVRARVTGAINLQYLEVSLQMSSFPRPPDKPASQFLLRGKKERKKEFLTPRRHSFSDQKSPVCLSNDSQETVMSWGKNNEAVMST